MFEPDYEITPLMLRQIKAIEEARGFLQAVRARPGWLEQLRRESQVRDALSSVQIEGNTLSYEEAFALSVEPPSDRPLRASEQEFVNYLRAFDAIEDLRGARDYEVTRRDVLSLHHLLVNGVRGGQRFAGQLRKEEVQIGDVVGGQVHVQHHPPAWTEVEGHLDDLFAWLARVKEYPKRREVMAGAKDTWVHPVIVAGIAQHRLAWIHPFVDGNGRSARMFTTLLLYQRGYDFKYLFDLSSYYNRNREAYYGSLRSADRTGSYTRWLMYFMGGFAMQMYTIKKRALKGADGLETGDDDAVDGDG